MWTRANGYCGTFNSLPCYGKHSLSEIKIMSIDLFTDVLLSVPFDWAFVQCGPEQLSERQYQSFLTSLILDDPMSFFEAKVALNLIAHRLDSQRGYSSTDSGVLVLIADIMRAGRNGFHTDDFKRLKEHLFDMPQINALFTSSMISAEMIQQGIESIAPYDYIS